jgi:hypothetical protein
MFRRKRSAWYFRVLALLVVIRILYAFARFFMKITARHAGMADAAGARPEKDYKHS